MAGGKRPLLYTYGNKKKSRHIERNRIIYSVFGPVRGGRFVGVYGRGVLLYPRWGAGGDPGKGGRYGQPAGYHPRVPVGQKLLR